MEKEDLFEKYCDIASDYLDSISYNDNKDYIVSLPLFRKVNDKIYICFYVEKKMVLMRINQWIGYLLILTVIMFISFIIVELMTTIQKRYYRIV